MGSPDDTIKLVDEMRELLSDARRGILQFLEDFRTFNTSMPERLYRALEKCPNAKDADAAIKCMEDLAEELKYLIERMDTMTEELNTSYNTLRAFLDIYYSISHRH